MDFLNIGIADLTDQDEELVILKSVFIFKQWMKRMHASHPDMTLENYHILMNSAEAEFTYLKKKIGWGDSFMIEQTNPTETRCGGDYRLVDFPEISIPHVGQIVMIKGVENRITEFGYLTFNATPCVDDNLDDDSSFD